MKPLLLFLATGFEEIEAISTLDILRRAGLTVNSVSLTNDLNVTGAHGITVVADCMFDQTVCSEAAMLILPGGMPGTTNLNQHDGLKSALLQHSKAEKPLAAICAAPMVLGQLGILEGKEATCYPGMEIHLKGAVLSEYLVVQDGNIVTASGPGVAAEFALQIVELFLGPEKMEAISEALLLR